MKFVSDLDTPLLRLSPYDHFTLRDAAQGVAIIGGTGSGKTSASGKALASAYLRAGMGGLVLAAKPDEVELWKRYAADNGRRSSLVIFGDGGHGGFNFLDYEMRRQSVAGIGSVIECLMTLLEADRLVKPNASAAEVPFWQNTARQLLRNTIPVLYAANGSVTIDAIYRFVTTAPTSQDGFRLKDGQQPGFMLETLKRAHIMPKGPVMSDRQRELIQGYWYDEFALADPKTRSNVVFNLSTNLDRFKTGRLHEHFCEATTLTPEDTFDGKIIVMAMPGLSWNEDGWIAQHLFKFMWQRAVLSRGGAPDARRPVFLWADEAQYFVNAFDATYQSTCRSSGGCTVYLTQSVPGYYAAFGGENGKAQADTFLGHFATKIFHANADSETNEWAARTIGRGVVLRRNYSEGETSGESSGYSEGQGTSEGANSNFNSGRDSWSSGRGNSRGSNTNKGLNKGRSQGSSRNEGYSETMDHLIEPATFARSLRTGGARNGLLVDALLFRMGARFEVNGRNFLPLTFQQ